MGILDYFKPVETMTPDRVKEFLRLKNPDDYNLVDVRQPHEYERGHLPGAKLIPVGELSGRMGELDPHKPTVTY
ncbi:MAG TPA: rhodanese-like domain-containing protein [Dissulfurispiraceae bacterium]|nr:rhodanese-like domain-containing protein [Dissulfurispiraceae bacterium]